MVGFPGGINGTHLITTVSATPDRTAANRLSGARHAIAAFVSFLVTGSLISFCGGGNPSPTSPPVDPPVQGACGFTVSQNQTNQTVAAAGVSVTIPVTAAAGCNWSARSNDAFLTITDAGSGNGNGSVVVAVAPNTGGERTGTLLIAGVTFTIKQDAAPCAFALGGDTSRTFGPGGGSGRITVTVTQGANCGWSATSNVSLMTITSGANGTGNGNVDFTVAANSGGSRSGMLTIANRTITVAQDGVTTTTSSTTTTTVPGTTTVPSTTTLPSTTTMPSSSTTTESSTVASTTTTSIFRVNSRPR